MTKELENLNIILEVLRQQKGKPLTVNKTFFIKDWLLAKTEVDTLFNLLDIKYES